MKQKDKFKKSGVKQFLEEIAGGKNIYISYGNHLFMNNEPFDPQFIENKTCIFNYLRKKGFIFKKDNSW